MQDTDLDDNFSLFSFACLTGCKQVVHIDYGSFASLSGGDSGLAGSTVSAPNWPTAGYPQGIMS